MFVEAPSTVVFVIMQMSLGLILNVIVGFSVVDGRWRGREAILDLDFTISHRCKCQFCQKRFSLRVLALRRVCKQMTIVAMRPCCKTGAKVVLRRSTTLRVEWVCGNGCIQKQNFRMMLNTVVSADDVRNWPEIKHEISEAMPAVVKKVQWVVL